MWKRATRDSIGMVRAHHFVDKGYFRQYQSKKISLIFCKDEVNETLDMWMNSFPSFNRTYII